MFCGQAQARQRKMPFEDWLKSLLDNNAHPRTCAWIDRENRIFGIAWMKQDNSLFEEEDARIFKDWSVHSGSYQDGNTRVMLKDRFRGVLVKARHIKRINTDRDETLNGKPCKTYQFTTDSKAPSCSMTSGNGPSDSMLNGWPPNSLDEFCGAYAMDTQETTSTELLLSDETMEVLTKLNQGEPLTLVQEDVSIPQNLSHIGQEDVALNPSQAGQRQKGNVAGQIGIPTTGQEHTTLHQSQAGKRQISSCHERSSRGNKILKVEKYNAYETAQGDDAGQIDIHYHGYPNLTRRFLGKCHIHLANDPFEGNEVSFPDPVAHRKDAKHQVDIEHLETLLGDKMKGGVVLEYDNGDIWATRHCLVRFFFSNFFTLKTSRKLERGTRTLVFSQKEFDTAYHEYQRDHSKMPCNTVYLGVGCKWYFGEKPSLPMGIIAKSRRSQEIIDRETMQQAFQNIEISRTSDD